MKMLDVQFRQATMRDLDQMYELINHYARQGLLLPRSKFSLCEQLRSFTVAADETRIVGVGGLHILWEDLAEIRSLAISPDARGKGIGKRLVEILVAEARSLAIRRVMALTYQVKFFQQCGFQVVSKEELPQKVWRDCLNCSKFPSCDETAMVKVLDIA
ncbi:N-acetyltransferase [Bacillaceae bacterium]